MGIAVSGLLRLGAVVWSGNGHLVQGPIVEGPLVGYPRGVGLKQKMQAMAVHVSTRPNYFLTSILWLGPEYLPEEL